MINFDIERDNNLVTVKSVEGVHPLSPLWSFTLWMYAINDYDFLKELRVFLENEEAYIVNKYPVFHDGGTSLGTNTVTSRFNTFNLFRLQKPVVQKLKTIVEEQFGHFIKAHKPEILIDDNFKPVVNCWYNVMRPDQEISMHAHSHGPAGFFSGHFTVACEESETYYVCPVSRDRLDFKNSPGEGIFFPSYIEHGTSKHVGIDKRITVAFDIYYSTELCTESLRNNVVKINKDRLCC